MIPHVLLRVSADPCHEGCGISVVAPLCGAQAMPSRLEENFFTVLFDAAPSLQVIFKNPKAVTAMRSLIRKDGLWRAAIW